MNLQLIIRVVAHSNTEMDYLDHDDAVRVTLRNPAPLEFEWTLDFTREEIHGLLAHWFTREQLQYADRVSNRYHHRADKASGPYGAYTLTSESPMPLYPAKHWRDARQQDVSIESGDIDDCMELKTPEVEAWGVKLILSMDALTSFLLRLASHIESPEFAFILGKSKFMDEFMNDGPMSLGCLTEKGRALYQAYRQRWLISVQSTSPHRTGAFWEP